MKGCVRGGLTILLVCIAILFARAAISFLQTGTNLYFIHRKPAAKCELADWLN